MKLYHRTTQEAADSIIKHGFRDGTGTYMTNTVLTGVWLSKVPLDSNEGAEGDVLLEVTIDITEAELTYYEVVEEGKPYREWLIPADWLNSKMLRAVQHTEGGD